MKKDKIVEIEENFKPYGTIAFIIVLLVLAGIIWFSVYNIQVERFN